MKKVIIGVCIFVFIVLFVIIAIYISFLNSYRYTKYQINLGFKYKNPDTVQYYDIEKIVDNRVQRVIQQNINLDETLGKQHDHLNDIYTLEVYNNMKETILKKEEIIIRNAFKNGDKNSEDISDFKIFWYAFTDKSLKAEYKTTRKVINKNKVEFETENQAKKEYYHTTYEKINKKWLITDMY